jgi:endonuclease/exonuclease/phosphatase (EEP) superfamily protein YafD
MNTLTNQKILLGDFNDTIWSYHHARMLEQTKLVNVRTRAKSFIVPSWPTWMMLKPLMIPIDQCLISPNIWVSSVKTGRDIGSDHLPLEVKLLFAPKKK